MEIGVLGKGRNGRCEIESINIHRDNSSFLGLGQGLHELRTNGTYYQLGFCSAQPHKHY